MAKERLIWADSLKGWLMLLVILGHAIQSILGADCDHNHIWNLIYSFHMPAFMAVSGWFAFRALHAKDDCKKKIIVRIHQLVIPYLLWSLVAFITKGNYSIEQFSKILINPDSYFWFLWVLFCICTIFTAAQWVADKLCIDELITIGAYCILLMGTMVSLELRVFGFQFIAYYFLFYTLGYCIHRFSNLQIKNNFIIIGTITAWAFLAWYWNMHALPSWMPTIPHVPSTLLQYAYRGVTALLAIEVLISLAQRLLNNTGKWNSWMKDFGEISLGIYIIHLLLLGSIAKGAKMITNNDPFTIVLTTIVAIVASYGVAKLLQKNRITAKYLLGKITKK